MSPALQAKLLQVLQDGEFSRLGGKHDVHVDVRIIAATNRDLERAVAEGQLREDLFFRLNVVAIQLPPLRERREDIALLAGHFVEANATYGVKRLGAAALAALEAYGWPGNVRELLHAIERAVILSKGDELQPGDLPPEVLHSGPSRAPSSSSSSVGSLETMERHHIVTTLRQVGGHRGKAAALLAIDPKTLYRKIISYAIMPAEFR